MRQLKLIYYTRTNSNLATPPEFDARQFPIIARHYFGVEPLARVIARLPVVDGPEGEAA